MKNKQQKQIEKIERLDARLLKWQSEFMKLYHGSHRKKILQRRCEHIKQELSVERTILAKMIVGIPTQITG